MRLAVALAPSSVAAFCVSPTALAQAPAGPGFTVKPPPGFESEDTTEQTTFVDVIVDKRKVGETPARFDAASIQFLDPQGLANILPSVRDFEVVARALTPKQSNHKEMSCAAAQARPDCGYVEPNPVAVIFTPETLQARVFVSELYTYGRDQDARFLPPPTVAPGAILGIDARAYTSLDDYSTSASATLQSVFGAGRNAIHANAFVNVDGPTSLRELYYQRTERTRELSVGYLDQTYGSGLARTSQLVGVRYGTTLKTRTDLSRLGASELPISLTGDATVEIRRDNDLLDVQRLSAGQTRLATGKLPDGSYNVTLRIIEGAQTREETRFFTTGGRLPPADAPQWTLEAGLLSQSTARSTLVPDSSGGLVAKASYARRIAAGIGVNTALSLGARDQFAEVALSGLGARTSWELGLVAGAAGDLGVYTNASYRLGRFNISGSYRTLSAADETRITSNARFDPFPNSQESGNLNASFRLPRGQIGVRGFYNKSSDRDASWSAGPTLDYTVASFGPTRLDLNAQYEWGDQRETAYIGLRLNFRFKSSPTGRTSSLYAQSNVRTTMPQRGAATRTEITEATYRTTSPRSAAFRTDYTLGVRTDNGDTGYEAGVRTEFPAANVDLDLRAHYQNQDTLLATVTSAVALGRAGVAFAPRFQDSGVIVSLHGGERARFDILQDGSQRQAMRANSSAFQPLAAYAIHDIAVRARNTSNVDYDGHADRIVAFPGNVPAITRRAYSVRIVVGQLVDAKGLPAPNAPIRSGVLLGTTDAGGYFQFDLADQTQATSVLPDGRSCTINLRGISRAANDNDFVSAGLVTCEANH